MWYAVVCEIELQLTPIREVRLHTVVSGTFQNNHKRRLPTHGRCEAVAAERARLRPTGYAVASRGRVK